MDTANELTLNIYNAIKELGVSESEAQLYAVSLRLGPVGF